MILPLHLDRRNPNLQYRMRDTELKTVQFDRDLGVHIDCDLKFRQHAAAVVAKATQVLTVIITGQIFVWTHFHLL